MHSPGQWHKTTWRKYMAKQNDIIKQLGLDIPKEIIDDETGEKLPIDMSKLKLAIDIIADVQQDIKRLA